MENIEIARSIITQIRAFGVTAAQQKAEGVSKTAPEALPVLRLSRTLPVVHVIQAANPSQVESHWHKRFAARRRNGEWFDLSAAEVNEFKSVSEM